MEKINKTKMLVIRIRPVTKKQLLKAAEKKGITMSSMANVILEEYLGEVKQ